MMKQLRQKVHSERRGVVLLLVLVALIAVSTALVSIARESYRVGQEAVRAREDLQMKWGEESLRRSVLPAAPAIYEEAEKAFRKSRREGRMPTEYSGVFSLGDAQFQFVLADEDARANVNSLYHYGDAEAATSAIRNLTGAFGAVRLNPEGPSVGGRQMVAEAPGNTNDNEDEDGKINADFAPVAFRSFGQVFDLNQVQNLQATTRQLSCWGSEGINVRRADDDTIVEVAGIVVGKGAARTMLTDYRRNRANQIDRMIDRHAANRWHRLQLRRLLSESSVCYSLWVRSNRGREYRDSFAVMSTEESGAMRTREVEYRGLR